MRAGLLIYGSLDTLSGGYLYDRKLVERLRAAGDEVEVIALPWRNYAAHLADNLSGALLRKLRSLDLDVLIQDELNHPSLFALNRRLGNSFPVVSIVHHLRVSESHVRIWRPLYRAVERSYLRSVDGFIFNSRTTQACVEALSGRRRPSIVAHPGGDRLPVSITAEGVERRAMEAGPLRVLFLGNLIPRKGLHTLLHALEALDPGSWKLTVAGGESADPGYAKRMRSRVRARVWDERVAFLGPVADERLLDILYAHHVLALPSQYEGFGIAYLEGMGAGLPALASAAGAAHEIVQEGETGYLIAPGDAGMLAGRLRALSADRALLARMAVRSRTAHLAHPGWAETMDRVREFLAHFW